MDRQICLIVSVLGLFGSIAHASLFVHNFDMHGDYQQYLNSTTNAFVLNEGQAGNPTVYWAPSEANVWGNVVYKYDLPFSITEASIYGTTLAITPASQAHLDVSPDGVSWHTVASGSVSVPGVPIDISSILENSNTAYVRARLLSDYVGGFSYAQFLRTYEDSPNMVPNIYEFRAVPEPTLAGMALGIALFLKRRRD